MNNFFIFCSLLLLGTCTEFVAEPYDPRLPVYSTNGRNTMGAYVNNNPVTDIRRSCDVDASCAAGLDYRVIDDSIFFDFGFHFEFHLVNEEFDNDSSGIERLKGATYQLNDESVALHENEESIEGKIEFVETNANFLSGTFYFRTEHYEVTNGRFDYVYSRE